MSNTQSPAHRLTSKGQVTIPKAIRDALGLAPGDGVEFSIRGDGAVTMEKAFDPAAYAAVVKAMTGIIDLDGMTTDEYMRFIRGTDDPSGQDTIDAA